jgi:hypothetical protein
MTTTVDLTKVYRSEYTARDDPATVDVPRRAYLMVDGAGDPNTSPAYQDALATLYPLAYGLRAAIKQATDIAYKVMPLEGLWWVEDPSQFSFDDRTNWRWTIMICQPDEADSELAATVLPEVTRKKKLPAGDLARLEWFGDGAAAQILHRGPYADEAPTIDRLHNFILDEGYQFRGRHHEIYLTDARKSDPARNRTILRQPISR